MVASFQRKFLDKAIGLVRGILCNDCNKGLGNFKDNIDLLLNAVSYLSKTRLEHEEY